MPDRGPRRVRPRQDRPGADLGTLVELGLAEPPPVPSETPVPGQGRRARLRAALAEVADVPLDADEEAALEALVRLPPGAVDQVVRWIRRAKRDR